MPLLEHGRITEDRWQTADEETTVTGSSPVIVPLARLEEVIGQTDQELGVQLPPDAQIEILSPFLERLSLVAIKFPIFRDGRAFSQARALREHLKFKGEIRVTGHILPDQYDLLLRCGVTTVEIPEGADVGAWQTAMARYAVATQPSVLGEKKQGFGLRRFV
ncbi:DUF934 domain-containing protein [Acetobacter sp. AN02]|uniref:DUF934 domain-containing protein n=1 Tax=Acetobacter sp. AN02 TaxID=2894186 RepID=UPI002434341D|nr:DUF934 domain-containing protein [Acetobacter sp. AN02]MDG6094645.1 DUF934 domain-containing protein [Acetobacter sp. AN02]